MNWKNIAAALALIISAEQGASSDLLLSDAEIAQVAGHGPWPPAYAPDPSNRVSGTAAGIDLGRTLFFSPRLSADGKTSCASCHVPEQFSHWQTVLS